MVVINLFAGPNAGKTTIAAGLFHELKVIGYNCEHVTEVAKPLHWDGRWSEIDCQPRVFGEQVWWQERYRHCGLDFLVTDSPLLLSLFYGHDSWHTPNFDRYIVDCHKKYDNLNVFIERANGWSSNGRAGDLDAAKRVDTGIIGILCDIKEPFLYVNHQNWKEVILDHLGRTHGEER